MIEKKKDDPEIRPDAWERFERAIDVVAKSPPQHRRKKVGSLQQSKAKRASSSKPKSASPGA